MDRDMTGARLDECPLMAIPRFEDQRGTLSDVDGPPAIPFATRRFHYIHNVAPEARRGCHAHRIEKQLIIAVMASVSYVPADYIHSFDEYLHFLEGHAD